MRLRVVHEPGVVHGLACATQVRCSSRRTYCSKAAATPAQAVRSTGTSKHSTVPIRHSTGRPVSSWLVSTSRPRYPETYCSGNLFLVSPVFFLSACAVRVPAKTSICSC